MRAARALQPSITSLRSSPTEREREIEHGEGEDLEQLGEGHRVHGGERAGNGGEDLERDKEDLEERENVLELVPHRRRLPHEEASDGGKDHDDHREHHDRL